MTTFEKTHSTSTITRTAASALVARAVEAAAGLGIEVAIAITDSGGHLKAFEATDGAPIIARDVAIDKAWTSAAFGLPTHVWSSLLASTPSIAQLAHRPRLVAVGGGYPLVVDGRLVGGIGVSGGSDAHDMEAAKIAMAAIGFDVPA